MDNLIEYKEGASYLNTQEPWYNKVESGRGRAYGVEFLLQKRSDDLQAGQVIPSRGINDSSTTSITANGTIHGTTVVTM